MTPAVKDASMRLVRTANSPETEIAWPAVPSLTCRSDAIGVSMLTGMNSEAISVDTQSVSANTAPQAPTSLSVRGSGDARRASL